MLGVDIREHGIGSMQGGGSSATTSLKYTVSLTKPSSPSKGDLWIQTNSSYSTLSVCRKLPTVTDANTLYLLVMGVYGKVNTTKINAQLNNGYTATVEFDINVPNSKNTNFMNVKIMNQGSDISWYGSPYQVYLGANKIETYSYNGTSWVKIGFVFYLQEGWNHTVDTPYGFWRYVLGDNKITKVLNIPYSNMTLPAYKMQYSYSLESARSGLYCPKQNVFLYTGYTSNIINQYYAMLKWDLNTNIIVSLGTPPLSRMILDEEYIYYLRKKNNINGIEFAKMKISDGSVEYTISTPLSSDNSYYKTLFFNIRKIGNKVFAWASGIDNGGGVSYLYGYIDLDSKTWKDLSYGVRNASDLPGIILDYDETNNTVYGVKVPDNSYPASLLVYTHNISQYNHTNIQTIQDCVIYNSDDYCGSYQYLNEDSDYVYFCYTNRAQINNFNNTSFFKYSKVSKSVEYLNSDINHNGTTKLDSNIGDSYFSSYSAIPDNGTNINTFTTDNNLFVYNSTGEIKYINYVEGNPSLTFNISSMVPNASRFSPAFVTNGIMDKA